MQDYKSVEAKSAEWNMSSRHIQYLCRNGRIEGAVKHAGVWFIPGHMPSPAKNSRSSDGDFEFVGTKRKVFYTAIALFVQDGYDRVSLRDIADKIGIRQSTIYNHFKSKQELLDAIYDFFCYYFLKDRPSTEEMEAMLQRGSPMEVIRAIRYDFKADYEQTMSDITKIIFQRIGIDSRARNIAKSLMVDEGIKYVEDVFRIAVDSGKFAPFDTHTMSVFINSVRIFTLYNWIIDPSQDNMMKLLADEQTLYEYAAGFIKDVNP